MSPANRPARRNRKAAPKPLTLFFVGAGLILLGIAVFLVLSGQETSTNSNSLQVVPAKVNYPAPELHLTDLQGNPVSLQDYSGKVVLVNNWATWCPPCKAEMPTLESFYQDYRQKGFIIVAIEAGEPISEVADFVQQFGLSFVVLPDPEMQALKVFGNLTLPNSYVIDRKGIIRLAWNGPIEREALEKFVVPLLEE